MKINTDTRAILYTLIDSVAYSLVPLLAALTINNIDIVPYLSISLFFSILAYLAYFKYIKNTPKIVFTKKIILYSSIGGIGFTLSHLLLLYSIKHSSNMFLPSIIFQIYPLVVMILLTILKMSRETITKEKSFLLLFALIGIVILNYDPTIISDKVDLISIILPILSALLLAFSIVYTLRLSEVLVTNKIKTAAFLANFYSKIISFIVMIPFMVWYANTDYTLDITLDNMLLMFVYGVIVLTFGTIFYYKGVSLTSKSLSIHIISYISAILSVLWLWIFGLGIMTSEVLIGSAFILTSNVLLHFNVDKSNAYNGSIIWTLLIGTFIFWYDATTYDKFYDAVTLPLLFFVVMLAFLMDRIFKRTDDEEHLILSILNNCSDEKDNELSSYIVHLNKTNSKIKIIAIYNKIKSLKISKENKLLIDKFILSRIQKIKFSELVVLSLTALLALYVLVFYTPGKELNDIFRLCLSTAIIFNLFYVLDNEKARSKNFIIIENIKGVVHSSINPKINTNDTVTEKLISIVLLFCILAIFFFVYSLD